MRFSVLNITLYICVLAILMAGFWLGTAKDVMAQANQVTQASGPSASGLPLPRFVSLSSDKVRARSGPGLRYPIEWEYRRDGLPVEVIKEFENWRKVVDIDGQGGWIHVSLLSGDRTALINAPSNVVLREAPLAQSPGVAAMQPALVVDLERCLEQWCRVRRADFSGWIERNFLWGVYEGEEID